MHSHRYIIRIALICCTCKAWWCGHCGFDYLAMITKMNDFNVKSIHNYMSLFFFSPTNLFSEGGNNRKKRSRKRDRQEMNFFFVVDVRSLMVCHPASIVDRGSPSSVPAKAVTFFLHHSRARAKFTLRSQAD